MFTESNTVEAYLSDLLADLGNPLANKRPKSPLPTTSASQGALVGTSQPPPTSPASRMSSSSNPGCATPSSASTPKSPPSRTSPMKSSTSCVPSCCRCVPMA